MLDRQTQVRAAAGERLEPVGGGVGGGLGQAGGRPVGGSEGADPAGLSMAVEPFEDRPDGDRFVVAVEQVEVDRPGPERLETGGQVVGDRGPIDAAARVSVGRMAALGDDHQIGPIRPPVEPARRVEGVAAEGHEAVVKLGQRHQGRRLPEHERRHRAPERRERPAGDGPDAHAAIVREWWRRDVAETTHERGRVRLPTARSAGRSRVVRPRGASTFPLLPFDVGRSVPYRGLRSS